jgi:hypothetical protein
VNQGGVIASADELAGATRDESCNRADLKGPGL